MSPCWRTKYQSSLRVNSLIARLPIARILVLLIFACAYASLTDAQPEVPSKRILILSSYSGQQYKWYAIAVLAAFLIQSMLVVLLVMSRIRRSKVEREREELSALVRAKHRHLNEVVSNVPGIVWETRTNPATKQRKTTFVSDYLQKMLGYTPEEWMKQPQGFGLTIIPEEDRERVACESDAVVETGKEGISEFRWYTKDGRIRWVENYLSPIVEENGEVVGLRGVALDITNRKLAEEAAQQ